MTGSENQSGGTNTNEFKNRNYYKQTFDRMKEMASKMTEKSVVNISTGKQKGDITCGS